MGSTKGCQQRWCLNTAVKDELELVGLRWVEWAEGSYGGEGWRQEQRGGSMSVHVGGPGCVGCPRCVGSGARDHKLLDVKVPGCLGGLHGPGPGPASEAQPGYSDPGPFSHCCSL